MQRLTWCHQPDEALKCVSPVGQRLHAADRRDGYDDDSTMTILAKAKWVTDQAHLTGLDVATMASALVVELTGAIRTAMAAMLISH